MGPYSGSVEWFSGFEVQRRNMLPLKTIVIGSYEALCGAKMILTHLFWDSAGKIGFLKK